MYLTLITPIPKTFKIWIVIYALLLISVIYMIAKKDEKYYKSAITSISTLFIVSCILNIGWVISFSYLMFGISEIFIFALTIVLAIICKKLLTINEGRRFLLPLTFGIYAGWLFISTFFNTALLLAKLQWNSFGLPVQLTAIIIVVFATILSLIVMINNKNAVYPLPILWGFIGIFEFLILPEGFKSQYYILQQTILVCIGALAAISLMQFLQNNFSIFPRVKNKKTN